MRFKWRGHLAVTALAALSLLPFTGCSSQQQQQGDEVMAEQQEGGEGQEGEENLSENAQGQEGEFNEEAAADASQANPSEEVMNQAATGEEVVSNPVNGEGNLSQTTDGDLQEIINEMGGNGNAAIAAVNSAPPVNDTLAAPVNNMAEVPANAVASEPASAPMADQGQPSTTAQVAGLPEMGSKMPYVIEAGDTLGKVAARIYGDQSRWKDISGLTGLTNPNHIFPGDVVYFSLDEQSAQFAAVYEGLQRSKEIVQEGDTLASIASRVYGSSRSWRHIWRQNDNIENPDQLTAGMTIYYINKDAIKTAYNELNKHSKLAKTANKSAKTLNKTIKVTSTVGHNLHPVSAT